MSHHQHAVRLRSGPRLSVTEWGRPDATVTVVLTHGLALSSLLWEDVAHTIVTANPAVRVLAYDHRGHGSSTKTPRRLRPWPTTSRSSSSSSSQSATSCWAGTRWAG